MTMRHDHSGREEFGGGLAAHELASSYVYLLENGAVAGPRELWDFEPTDAAYLHWCRFFSEQAALDGLRVVHQSYVETSWGNALVVLARPTGVPSDLPLSVDTYGWGLKYPSLFTSKGQRIYRKMRRDLERERRRERETDWGETLTTALRRAKRAAAIAGEQANVPRRRKTPVTAKATVAPITEFLAKWRLALSNPHFDFDPFVRDPTEPCEPMPHAADCDGACDPIIPHVLYTCRTARGAAWARGGA
jgi:hypothetical protein